MSCDIGLECGVILDLDVGAGWGVVGSVPSGWIFNPAGLAADTWC